MNEVKKYVDVNVWIDDVGGGYYFIYRKKEANNEVFNVGTGIAIDVVTVAKKLFKNFGVEVPQVISGNYRLGDIRHNFADLSKIQSV